MRFDASGIQSPSRVLTLHGRRKSKPTTSTNCQTWKEIPMNRPSKVVDFTLLAILVCFSPSHAAAAARDRRLFPCTDAATGSCRRRDPNREAAPPARGAAPEGAGRDPGVEGPDPAAAGDRPGDAAAGRAGQGAGQHRGGRPEGPRAAGVAQADHRLRRRARAARGLLSPAAREGDAGGHGA